MSAITPVPPPITGLAARTDSVTAQAGPQRPAPAAPVETARALLPAETARDPATIRFVDREGRPVGPPPAFQITLLEARRQATMPPAPGPEDGSAPGGYAGRGDEDAADLVDRRV